MGVTLLLAILALLIRLVADDLLPPGFPYVTFFPAVILTSFLFGVPLGTISALLCGVFAWYFFIPPTGTMPLHGGAALALGFYVFVVSTDILLVHWMQRANQRFAAERERSRALAETRELLFRELQHRVSNNLQVTAALLTLQKRHVRDESARAALEEASRRVSVIGRISRQLYAADGGLKPLRELLDPLCAEVIDASGKRIVATVDDGGNALSSDVSVPVALIVAESIANAIEHGVGARDEGRIDIACTRQDDGALCIDVRDDGAGLPPGFVLQEANSLGLRIATMLAGQIGGRYEMLDGKGATARLVLPT